MSSNDDSGCTFVSCSSGNESDVTYISCRSDPDEGRVMDNSQELDNTVEEVQLEHLEEDVKDMDGEEGEREEDEETEEEDKDSVYYDSDLNSEALDALEESLKQQLDQLKNQEKEFNAMFDATVENLEVCNKDVMDRTEEVKKQTAVVENETKALILDRDQAMSDLRNVEQAFSDVHRKYERAKVVLENLKTNEEHLMQRDEEFQLLISAREEKSEAFKQEMHQSLEKMYNDFQVKLGNLDADNAKLAAQYRRSEMRIETLESELAHKQKENAQLNNLADDLIGRSVNNQ